MSILGLFRLKFTSQKTRCICISETNQSVPPREVVSSIYFGGYKNIEYVVWENCRVFNVEPGGRYSYGCA